MLGGTATEDTVCARCGDAMEIDGEAEIEAGTLCQECFDLVSERRRSSRRGETALRRISSTFYLIAFFGMLFAFSGSNAMASGSPLVGAIVAGLGLTVTVASVIVGRGLARLRPWASVPAMVLLVPVFPVFPLGTIVAVEAMFTLVRNQQLLSDDYRRIIAWTPHLDRPEISRTQLVVIGVLLLGIAAFVVWLFQ